MSNQEIRYLIKNEIQYLYYLTPKSKHHVRNIYKKYKDIINSETILILNTKEKLFCYINKIKSLPICAFCGINKVKFTNFTRGYCDCCSAKCSCNFEDKINKKKQTNLKRYGVECSFSNKEVQNKIKATCVELYGTSNPAQSEIIKDRMKQTNLEKYGTEYFLSSNTARERIVKTNLETYGYENPNKNANVVNKRKQTNLQRYGTENPTQSKEIRRKISKSRIILPENMLNLFIQAHGDFYDYDFTDYIDSDTKMRMICPVHGEFWQKASSHKSGVGCPSCKRYYKGEEKVKTFLLENNLAFERYFKFNDCRYKNELIFDFYLTKLNVCIEYDGEQHYNKFHYFHRHEKSFELQVLRDKIKTEYCRDNNIQLIRIPHYEFDNIETILMKNLIN